MALPLYEEQEEIWMYCIQMKIPREQCKPMQQE